MPSGDPPVATSEADADRRELRRSLSEPAFDASPAGAAVGAGSADLGDLIGIGNAPVEELLEVFTGDTRAHAHPHQRALRRTTNGTPWDASRDADAREIGSLDGVRRRRPNASAKRQPSPIVTRTQLTHFHPRSPADPSTPLC